MKLIALYKGRRPSRRFVGFCSLDDEDYERLGGYHWRVNGRGYVIANVDGRTETMHREILGLLTGDRREGDHINLDKLDNRRENLRVVSRGQNAQNLRSVPGTTSRYRGVDWFPLRNKWRAKVAGKHLGLFPTEEEAHAAAEAHYAATMPFSPEAREVHKPQKVEVGG